MYFVNFQDTPTASLQKKCNSGRILTKLQEDKQQKIKFNEYDLKQ